MTDLIILYQTPLSCSLGTSACLSCAPVSPGALHQSLPTHCGAAIERGLHVPIRRILRRLSPLLLLHSALLEVNNWPCEAQLKVVQDEVQEAEVSPDGCRGGWKGKPVVVLGRKEDIPMGLLPLVSIVARPVKHARLVTALLKATALMRSKAQVPTTFGGQYLHATP